MRHQMRSAFRLSLEEKLLAAPDFFKVVIVANIGLQHVANNLTAVNQHPFARVVTLHANHAAAGFLDSMRNCIREGPSLAAGSARGDHDTFKLICKFFRIEDLDVARFDVFKSVDDGLSKRFEFH